MVRVEINTREVLADIKKVTGTLETMEARIIEIADEETKKTVEELVRVIAGMAPESETGEYDPSLQDYPPAVDLENSFYVERDESSSADIAWMPNSLDKMRANILEEGATISPFSAKHQTSYERGDGETVNTLGYLAIPVDGTEYEPDEQIDGTGYIFRQSVKGGKIEPRKYIERAVTLYDPETRLRQRINRRLRSEFR